ncbi:hypothetical protein SEEHRA36_24786, partial [Salmonella enterica subsp. enterica serovar Heidelberg str. SARA36]
MKIIKDALAGTLESSD